MLLSGKKHNKSNAQEAWLPRKRMLYLHINENGNNAKKTINKNKGYEKFN